MCATQMLSHHGISIVIYTLPYLLHTFAQLINLVYVYQLLFRSFAVKCLVQLDEFHKINLYKNKVLDVAWCVRLRPHLILMTLGTKCLLFPTTHPFYTGSVSSDVSEFVLHEIFNMLQCGKVL